MNKKICVALLALLLAACANSKLADTYMANSSSACIELLPEHGVSIDDAREAFAIIDQVVTHYQFERSSDDETTLAANSARSGERLVFARYYFLNMDSFLDEGKIQVTASYSKSGMLQVLTGKDNTVWTNSLMGRRIRYEIASEFSKAFGGSRVNKKRIYNYRAE